MALGFTGPLAGSSLGDAVDPTEFEGVTTGSYLRGAAGGDLEERTPAQVRSDLGSGMAENEILQANDSGALVNRSLGAAGIQAAYDRDGTDPTAGTTQDQANATLLTKRINYVDVGTANDGVRIPDMSTWGHDPILVVNKHASNNLKVYPFSGQAISVQGTSAGTNTAIDLAGGASATFVRQSDSLAYQI